MTLENTLLTNLSDWRPKERDTLRIALPDSDWVVQLTADRCDELSCKLWEVTVKRSQPAENLKLQDWAQQIPDKIHGLADSLKVLEVDNQQQQALIRSESPFQKEERLFYFEVVLQDTTTATLRRFQGSHEAYNIREQVSFVLTKEMVVNVIEALLY